MKNSLPKGWIEVALGDVFFTTSGGTPSRANRTFYNGTIPWVKSGELNYNSITDTDEKITENAIDNSSAKIFPKGTLLIALYGATIGKLAFLEIDAATNQAVCGIFKNDFTNIRFLYWYLFFKRPELVAAGTGGAQPNISQTLLKELRLPLPPLSEQHRIVSALDALMAKVATCKARLEKIPALVKSFRQSVLTAAVSGELSAKNGDETQTNWLTIRAAEACEKVESGSTPKGKPFFAKEEIPYLKVYNIVNQQIAFDYKPQFIKREVHEKELKRCKVFPNDVLMNIVGPPLGKVALVPDDYDEWNINQALVLFRPKEFLLPKFLYYTLCEGTEVRAIETETRGSAGQSNISLTQCRNFSFNIPPIAEQEEILSRIDELFGLAERIEARYAKALAWFDKIPQAVLTKAFRGELVMQRDTDGSALQLLEEIKAQKAEQEEKSKLNKQKPKKISMTEKLTLLEEIRKAFQKSTFTFEDLSLKTSKKYSDLKEELFKLLDEGEELALEFDETSQRMKFKLLP